jgi:tetratricopeptide (TPR) repeat protein
MAYRRALALEPKDESVWYYAHNNLGFCLNQIHRHSEAEPFLRQAIEIDPKRYNAYKNLGVSLEAQGEYAEAAQLFVKAMVISPHDIRDLVHLEDLLDEHEVVYLQVPEIRADLERCRQIVRKRGAA